MKFEEWLDEIECYGSRQERLGEELPVSDVLINWLRAAYEVGYEQGKKAQLEKLDSESEMPKKSKT